MDALKKKTSLNPYSDRMGFPRLVFRTLQTGISERLRRSFNEGALRLDLQQGFCRVYCVKSEYVGRTVRAVHTIHDIRNPQPD